MTALTSACSVSAFFDRFTTAELAALVANTTALAIIVKMLAYGANRLLDTTDPVITGYMAQAVAAGLITSARSAQILNLAVNSP
jgi:hypothetical protein